VSHDNILWANPLIHRVFTVVATVVMKCFEGIEAFVGRSVKQFIVGTFEYGHNSVS
jgi:hypothetical protein